MSPFAGDGVAEGVPEVFRAHLADSALGDGTGGPFVTACLWREAGDDRWRHGRIDFPAGLGDPDGTSHLFGLLVDGTAGLSGDSPRGPTSGRSTWRRCGTSSRCGR